jgi:hypothetical protein
LNRAPQAQVFVRSFLDYLVLALEGPYGIKLGAPEAYSAEITSAPRELRATWSEPIELGGLILSVAPSEGSAPGTADAVASRLALIREVVARLQRRGTAAGVVVSRLRAGLEARSTRRRGADATEPHLTAVVDRVLEKRGVASAELRFGGLTLAAHDQSLSSFRNALDELLAELDGTPILDFPRRCAGDGSFLLNLFAVVMYAGEHWALTRRLLITAMQEHHVRTRGIPLSEFLDVDDLPFCIKQAENSGCVAWAGHQQPGGSRQHRLLGCAGADPGPADGSAAPLTLAIPCAVGLVNWMVFYTCLHDDETSAWWKAYVLYRDILPRYLQKIRSLAQFHFCSQLLHVFRQELQAPTPSRDRINDGWARVGATFPFPLPKLYDGPPEAEAADRSMVFKTRERTWHIPWEPVRNPFFGEIRRPVPFTSWGELDELTLQQLFFDPIQASASAMSWQEKFSRSQAQSLVYKLGHPFKHRAINVTSAADEILDALRKVDHRLAGKADATLAKELAEIRQSALLAVSYGSQARSYGELANMLGALVERGGPEGLFDKESWFSLEPVDLLAVVKKCVALAASKDVGMIRARLVRERLPASCIVRPFLAYQGSRTDLRGRRCTPSALVYEQVFLELAHNAASHGLVEDNRVAVTVLAKLLDRDTCLYLANAIPPSRYAHRSPAQGFFPYRTVAENLPSGASLAARILKETGIGEIEESCQRPPKERPDAGGVWIYRVRLRGLECQEQPAGGEA